MDIHHVLVIEDAYLFGEYLRDIVTLAGARSVTVVATQSDAIAEANKRLPSLILSDVNLAEGTGPAAVATIIANHGRIPVIFITGDNLGHATYTDGSLILSKPVAPNALLDAIHELSFGNIYHSNT